MSDVLHKALLHVLQAMYWGRHDRDKPLKATRKYLQQSNIVLIKCTFTVPPGHLL